MYRIKKLTDPQSVDALWGKASWKNAETLTLDHFMGDRPEHRPCVQVRAAYDDKHIRVIFRVKDRYIRSLTSHYQGRVYEDSCVEFFFTPSNDVGRGYFNLEINCSGTALFHFQTNPGAKPVKIKKSDFDKIAIAHSLPKIIPSEITERRTWTLEYSLPVAILEKYCPVTMPAPDVRWRANFFKCADKSTHPHWLTWAFVDFPEPRFHMPEFFGILEFE